MSNAGLCCVVKQNSCPAWEGWGAVGRWSSRVCLWGSGWLWLGGRSVKSSLVWGGGDQERGLVLLEKALMRCHLEWSIKYHVSCSESALIQGKQRYFKGETWPKQSFSSDKGSLFGLCSTHESQLWFQLNGSWRKSQAQEVPGWGWIPSGALQERDWADGAALWLQSLGLIFYTCWNQNKEGEQIKQY